MKILITSIGSLSAKFVIEQCKSIGAEVYGSDINEIKYLKNASALDKFYKVSKVKETEKYKKELEFIIQDASITHILPLTDLDVDFFANTLLNSENEEIKILVANKGIVNLIRNKLEVSRLFKESSVINCIPTFTVDEYRNRCNVYPAIAKINNGRSSEHILHITEERQLEFILNKNYIVQPKIDGDIVTVDIICDGHKLLFVQRKEIFRTSNGAGTTVEIINNVIINNCIIEFFKQINYRGVLNIEFILNNEKVYLMDVNPRFSAGVAFSNIAGYDFVTNAIKYLEGLEIESIVSVKEGMIVTKVYKEIIM